MGVLIVVATTVLVVLIARRIGGGAWCHRLRLRCCWTSRSGTRIAAIAAAGDRLAVQLQGGGPDRVLLVDPRNGRVAGRIGLRAP